jgi:hypothetical protein
MTEERSASDGQRRETSERSSRWKSGCAGIVAAVLLITVLACALGTAGLWRRAIAPPRFDQSIGALRLVGYSTWNGSCPPYTGCAPTQRDAYVVWLIWGSGGQSKDTHQLVNQEIAH